MSSRVSPYPEWLAAVSAAFEGLIHPSVEQGPERSHQLRLAAVLFAAPFLFAGAAAQLLAAMVGFAQTLALASAVFAASWLTAALLLATGRRRLVETGALVMAVPAVAALIAIAGGVSSPMTLLAGALAAECYWIARTRRAAMTGAFAGAVAVALSFGAGTLGFGGLPSVTPSAAQWLVPLIYIAMLGLRFTVNEPVRADADAAPEASGIEERMSAVLLRVNRSGDVMHASSQAETLLNVRSDILLGNGFFQRIHVADRVAYLCAVSDINEGAEARTISMRLRMPVEQGTLRAPGYRQFGVELLSAAGEGGAVVILRDEAGMAELEHDLARAREEARVAKVESKRMLAAVSHELRTPLNAILGFSDTLLSEIFGQLSNEKQREYVRLINEAGGHLLSVVNSTLEISKLEAGTYTLHPEAFRFSEVVDPSVAFVQGDASARSIDIEVAIADSVGVVYCDRRAVQQVLINLLSNAVKFSHANGKISVLAERSGNRLDFSVSDNGVGIAAADLERIGEPFAQVRTDETRHVEGTGLGLALAKGLVGLQGGGMTIDSAPGEGTRVSISLPVGVGEDKDQNFGNGKPAIDDEWSDEEYRKTA